MLLDLIRKITAADFDGGGGLGGSGGGSSGGAAAGGGGADGGTDENSDREAWLKLANTSLPAAFAKHPAFVAEVPNKTTEQSWSQTNQNERNERESQRSIEHAARARAWHARDCVCARGAHATACAERKEALELAREISRAARARATACAERKESSSPRRRAPHRRRRRRRRRAGRVRAAALPRVAPDGRALRDDDGAVPPRVAAPAVRGRGRRRRAGRRAREPPDGARARHLQVHVRRAPARLRRQHGHAGASPPPRNSGGSRSQWRRFARAHPPRVVVQRRRRLATAVRSRARPPRVVVHARRASAASCGFRAGGHITRAASCGFLRAAAGDTQRSVPCAPVPHHRGRRMTPHDAA